MRDMDAGSNKYPALANLDRRQLGLGGDVSPTECHSTL